jgi:uncharacterized membrane protein (UPF0127 family)
MKKRIAPFAVFLALTLVVTGCEKMKSEGPMTAEEMKSAEMEGGADLPEPGAALAVGTVVVKETPFSVEIARTDEEKAKGLMNREALPSNSGMWFVFSRPVQEEFWMKDTLIPLDIIFVGKDLRIVHIKENAVPKSVEMISSPEPFMYVLEVNADKASQHGIKIGDEVQQRIGPKTD